LLQPFTLQRGIGPGIWFFLDWLVSRRIASSGGDSWWIGFLPRSCGLGSHACRDRHDACHGSYTPNKVRTLDWRIAFCLIDAVQLVGRRPQPRHHGFTNLKDEIMSGRPIRTRVRTAFLERVARARVSERLRQGVYYMVEMW